MTDPRPTRDEVRDALVKGWGRCPKSAPSTLEGMTDAVVELLAGGSGTRDVIDGRGDEAQTVIARFFAHELAGELTEPNDTHRDVAIDLLSELRAAGLVYDGGSGTPPTDDQPSDLDIYIGSGVARGDGQPAPTPDQEQLLAQIEERRNDPEFMGRIRASIDRNRPLLDRLALDDAAAPTPGPTRDPEIPLWVLDADGNPTCDGITVVPSRQRGAGVRCTDDASTSVVVLHASAHAALVALLSRSAAEPPEVDALRSVVRRYASGWVPWGEDSATWAGPLSVPIRDRFVPMTPAERAVIDGVAAEPNEATERLRAGVSPQPEPAFVADGDFDGDRTLTSAEIDALSHHGHWDVEEIEVLVHTVKALNARAVKLHELYLTGIADAIDPPRSPQPEITRQQIRATLVGVLPSPYAAYVEPRWVEAMEVAMVALLADGATPREQCNGGRVPHLFEPGIDEDDPEHPDPRWCNTCGEPTPATVAGWSADGATPAGPVDDGSDHQMHAEAYEHWKADQ